MQNVADWLWSLKAAMPVGLVWDRAQEHAECLSDHAGLLLAAEQSEAKRGGANEHQCAEAWQGAPVCPRCALQVIADLRAELRRRDEDVARLRVERDRARAALFAPRPFDASDYERPGKTVAP